MLSIEDAIAMQGTEFQMEFGDGDTISAYVKKFDAKKGLSCWSFGMVTDNGFKFNPKNEDEEAEGAVCVIGADFLEDPDNKEWALEVLEEILLTGKWVEPSIDTSGSFAGCPL